MVAYMDDVFHGNVVEITGPADNDWTISDPPVYINPRCVTCGLEECVQEVECKAKYLEDLKEADKAEENEVQSDIEFHYNQNYYVASKDNVALMSLVILLLILMLMSHII